MASTGAKGPQTFASVRAWLDAQYAAVDHDYERNRIPERAGWLLSALHRKGEAKDDGNLLQVADRGRFLAELAELKAHAPGGSRIDVTRKPSGDGDGRETIIISFAGVELVRMHQFAGDEQPGRFASRNGCSWG